MRKPIVKIRSLNVWFSTTNWLSQLWGSGSPTIIKAVDGLNIDLFPGETLALVGESGSGKTTVAKSMMALLPETRGEIWFEGCNVVKAKRSKKLEFRSKMQMIFQETFDAMNPRDTIFNIVSEPLEIHRPNMSKDERRVAVVNAISDVGLHPPKDFLYRHPHELSGGQRQRVLIASALTLDPAVIIADEPVSMLDVSSKVEVLELMMQLKSHHTITYLLITHDMALMRYVADRIAVMYLGVIVELGPARQVIKDPQHPYTKALIDAVPTLDVIRDKKKAVKGEIPHHSCIPTGCRFHPRCPLAVNSCGSQMPELRSLSDQRFAACHVL